MLLKKRTPKNKTRYKEHKNLFETINRKYKNYYSSNQIMKCVDNIKKTWEIIQKIIRKEK